MGRDDRQEGRKKKLIEAARRWASGGGGPDEAAEDLAAFGVAPEEIEKWIEERKETNFAVWPENWPAVECFVALSTQWRTAGQEGARVGLDYAAIPPVAAMLGHDAGRDLFQRLQVLEFEALEVFARSRKKR